MNDLRRPDKIVRYKRTTSFGSHYNIDNDTIQEYMNVLGMLMSMVGLMMKIKWCAWIAVLSSFVGFAYTKSTDDNKQVVSCFMLSISALVMSYMQSMQPMTLPFI